MELNKYKKLLEEKTSNNSSFDGTDFLPFFNPNRLLQKSKSKQVVVRILPRKNNELFFMQFKKHSFKVGTAYKNNFCPYSLDSSGERIGNSCPFCDFVSNNKDILDKSVFSKLGSKDSHIMAIYNYVDDEVQKYEVNYYGITDILTAMQNLDDEFDPDEEGFDLIFERDNKGYAKAVNAIAPELKLSAIAKDSNSYNGETPAIENEVIPKNIDKYYKKLKVSFEYALKAFAPSFANKETLTSNNDSDDDTENYKTVSSKKNYDPQDDDDVNVVTKSSNIQVSNDDSDDEDDDDIADIKEFLKKRKNKS